MPQRSWEIPERKATSENAFLGRRTFLRTAGISTAALLAGCGYDRSFDSDTDASQPVVPTLDQEQGDGGTTPSGSGYPAPRNSGFATLDRPITEEEIASRYNNFYEFTAHKDVYRKIDAFEPTPWQIEVDGLVEQPKTYDFDALVRTMPLEERLYRHRCVEAWSMAIPWTGFPMRTFIDEVRPLLSARYVRMVSFFDPEVARGQWISELPWPYQEGLTMEEATNELTMLVTGTYGDELHKQQGAPLRLIAPWKYGFKGIKSIVHFEFTAEQPATFWTTAAPTQYGFSANVDPRVPHPNWSQATEQFILSQTEVEERPTLSYNGYEEFVAHLYG